MANRITQGMMNNQLLRNISANLLRMNKSQDQLSTGRKLNKPSDDPVGITYSMRYRSELSANEQFKSNTDATVSWLDYTDTMLSQTNDIVQRARELAVKGANGTNPQTAMNAIKIEIDQLYSQTVIVGNSEFNGKHVFNGQLTDKAPYTDATAATDVADTGQIKIEIGSGVLMAANVSGATVFGAADDPANPGTNDNLFRVLKDLSKALGTSDFAGVESALGRLDQRHDALLEARADIGAKSNRVELSQSRLEDVDTNLQKLQASAEDADIPSVITSLKTDENVYQSSLAIGAKLISPSLIDFLH